MFDASRPCGEAACAQLVAEGLAWVFQRGVWALCVAGAGLLACCWSVVAMQRAGGRRAAAGAGRRLGSRSRRARGGALLRCNGGRGLPRRPRRGLQRGRRGAAGGARRRPRRAAAACCWQARSTEEGHALPLCQNRLLKSYLRVYTMLPILARGRNVLCVGMVE